MFCLNMSSKVKFIYDKIFTNVTLIRSHLPHGYSIPFFATLVTGNHNKDGIVTPKNYPKKNSKTLWMIEKIPLMLLWQTMTNKA